MHVEVSDELEDETIEALEDMIHNEACLASDVLELLNSQDIDDESTSDHSYHQVDDPTPSSTAVSLPMIERELWVSYSNPVRLNTPWSCVHSRILSVQFSVLHETSVSLCPPPPNMPERADVPRTICATSLHSRDIFFSPEDLNRLLQPYAWLNDVCINGGSQAILRYFGSSGALCDPALFSTWVIATHLLGDDDALWRHSRVAAEFWKKDIWLIPIHRDGNHWTLAIVYWRKKRIAYFDSFSSKRAFETDVKV